MSNSLPLEASDRDLRNSFRLEQFVQGKEVALVGRAASIIGSGNGKAIDDCEVVIRINWVLPLSIEYVHDVGLRTNAIYHCKVHCGTSKLAAQRAGVPNFEVNVPLRKELGDVGYRPNTGVVAIYDILQYEPAKIKLFGYDNFKTGHAPGKKAVRTKGRTIWKHDPTRDVDLLRDLIAQSLIEADEILKEALSEWEVE